MPARRATSIDPVTMEELLAAESAQRSLRGVIPLHDIGSDQLRIGERIIAVVTQPEGADGRVVLSLGRVRNRKQWAQLEEMQENGAVIDAPVLEATRGGVIVDVGLPETVKALVGRRLQVRC